MSNNVDKIYETLKREIINLDLVPGSKIKEEDLASRFQISRTPIRSVIARLVSDSLLVVESQKGTYVSKINAGIINDYIYIRKSVEKKVIEEVADIITDEQIETLKEILEEQHSIILMEPSILKSKLFYHNDNRFHNSLFSFVGLDGVWKIIHSNATPLNRVRIMSNLRENDEIFKVYQQHYKVYENLKKHNKEEAVRAFVEHLDSGFDGLNTVIEKYKDYFI